MGFEEKNCLRKVDLKWKKINVNFDKVYTKKIINFITDEHIDIIVRYLYVKAYVEKKDYKKYKKIYEQMQIKRIGCCNISEFNRIIDSFIENGYLKEFPIPINKKGKILNGSHRLACCLYFNINPYVIEFDEDDHDYGIDWFRKNGFSFKQLNEILDVKNQLIKEFTESKVKLKKIYAAMISPMNQLNRVDCEYFKKHANSLFENGIEGLFVCGNTGNGINLSNDIKKEILEASLSIKKGSIICHVGANTQEEIFEFVKFTNNCNIDCIACMPPYKTINEFKYIKQFYEKLTKLSNKPLLIYHIPSVTGINLNCSQIIELLNITNVVGMKYTDSDIEKLKYISKQAPKKYIFFGRDDLLYDGLNNGATGGIGGCYNLFPKFISNIVYGRDSLNNQKKLQYCIKRLRQVYPSLPGGEFVLKSLKIKNNMNDIAFYNYLRRNENDKIDSI